MIQDRMKCDLLVVGGGMAGLCAGAWAAEHGARVIVVEKAGTVGGSAALSGGVFWTVQSARKAVYHARARAELTSVVSAGYGEAIRWFRRRGVAMSPAMPVLNGRGYQIDILSHLKDCVAAIEAAGGHIALDSTISSLSTDEANCVIGGVVSHADGEVEVSSRWTLIASGGFQNDPELRTRLIHPQARTMRLRSNTTSDGGGLRLGRSVGAAVTEANGGFYGHLVTASPRWGDPRYFTLLSQYHSEYGILINEAGERFCDESEGDHVNALAVLRQPGARAMLVWDEKIQQERVLTPFLQTTPIVDRMEIALQHGAEGGIMQSLEDVERFASAHGFEGAAVGKAIDGFRRSMEQAWEDVRPPRTENHESLAKPPYYVLIVHPAITYTFGGLRIAPDGQVLSADGRPVGGLLAAGADAGDLYKVGYAGGLAQAAATGLRAARTAGYG